MANSTHIFQHSKLIFCGCTKFSSQVENKVLGLRLTCCINMFFKIQPLHIGLPCQTGVDFHPILQNAIKQEQKKGTKIRSGLMWKNIQGYRSNTSSTYYALTSFEVLLVHLSIHLWTSDNNEHTAHSSFRLQKLWMTLGSCEAMDIPPFDIRSRFSPLLFM